MSFIICKFEKISKCMQEIYIFFNNFIPNILQWWSTQDWSGSFLNWYRAVAFFSSTLLIFFFENGLHHHLITFKSQQKPLLKSFLKRSHHQYLVQKFQYMDNLNSKTSNLCLSFFPLFFLFLSFFSCLFLRIFLCFTSLSHA